MARTATRKPAPLPTLRDPLLTALLSYIDGGAADDDDGRKAVIFGRALQGADRLLTSEPITSAFQLFADRPAMYEVVAESIVADLPNWTAPIETRRAFEAVEMARHDEGPDTIDSSDVNMIANSYIDHGMLLGACLMYRLLKGGAR
jgi:hypothetical protein